MTPKSRLTELAREMESKALHLIRQAAYLDARGELVGHAGAVEHQNRRVKRVRKALGYTYPQDDLNF